MSNGARHPESFGKERESRTHQIARATIAAVGIAGFVVVAGDRRWLGVAPRRGNTEWSEERRRCHEAAVRARAGEIWALLDELAPATAVPDPAALAAPREMFIAAGDEEEGLHNVVLRVMSIERRARLYARFLREPRGLSLRRDEANELAELLEVLAQRSLRAIRKRAAA